MLLKLHFKQLAMERKKLRAAAKDLRKERRELSYRGQKNPYRVLL